MATKDAPPGIIQAEFLIALAVVDQKGLKRNDALRIARESGLPAGFERLLNQDADDKRDLIRAVTIGLARFQRRVDASLMAELNERYFDTATLPESPVSDFRDWEQSIRRLVQHVQNEGSRVRLADLLYDAVLQAISRSEAATSDDARIELDRKREQERRAETQAVPVGQTVGGEPFVERERRDARAVADAAEALTAILGSTNRDAYLESSHLDTVGGALDILDRIESELKLDAESEATFRKTKAQLEAVVAERGKPVHSKSPRIEAQALYKVRDLLLNSAAAIESTPRQVTVDTDVLISVTHEPTPAGGPAVPLPDGRPKQDALGRKQVAAAIADLLLDTGKPGTTQDATPRKKKTTPIRKEPLTIGVFGDWGAGKSTLMDFVKDELESREVVNAARENRKPRKLFFAELNAWAYEKAGNMAAALTQVVANRLGRYDRKILGFFAELVLAIRFHLGFQRASIARNVVVLALAVLLFILGIFWIPEIKDHDLRDLIINALGVGTVGGLAALIFALGKWLRFAVEHPFAENVRTYLELPQYRDHLGVTALFSEHIGRLTKLRLKSRNLLFLKVEDLDRCDPACIEQTFDAIRLAMDKDNVVVMVGIDPRIAMTAMAERYESVSDALRTSGQVARDYLGKIVQIPVCLSRPNDADIENLVEKRLFSKVILPPHEKREEQQPSGGTGQQKEGGSFAGEPPDSTQNPPEDASTAALAKDSQQAVAKSNGMKHSLAERTLFKELARDFQFHNPRLLLRLRNSYRLLRSLAEHWNPDKPEDKASHLEMMQLLFWLEFLAQQGCQERAQLLRVVHGDIDVDAAQLKHAQLEVYRTAGRWVQGFYKLDSITARCNFVRQVVLPSVRRADLPPHLDKSNNRVVVKQR